MGSHVHVPEDTQEQHVLSISTIVAPLLVLMASCFDGLASYMYMLCWLDRHHCTINIDDCSPIPCLHGGFCIVRYCIVVAGINYLHACYLLHRMVLVTHVPVLGYSVNSCQTDIDECASNPCFNGATLLLYVTGNLQCMYIIDHTA